MKTNVVEKRIMTSDFFPTFPIKFLNPDQIDPLKEKCSKLLDPASDLYRALAELRQSLRDTHGESIAHPPRMDFHIEVMKWQSAYTEVEMLERVHQLENQVIKLTISHLNNKAMVIECPEVEGYGPTHITVAYFPAGLPFPDFK